MWIVDYVGAKGVRTHSWHPTDKARPGDLVRFPDKPGLGRIASPGGLVEWDEFMVCETLGSAFLDITKGGEPYVSISGGPFKVVKRAELRQSLEFDIVPFWNWGDHLAGAEQGVTYHLARPVFTYCAPG